MATYQKTEESIEGIKIREEYIKKINERGYVLKKEADWLLQFDRKFKICETCGKSTHDGTAWSTMTMPNRYGEQIEAGYDDDCFFCSLFKLTEEENV